MLHKPDKEHWRSPLNLLIELLLVGAGVFLALLANNWHEARQHHNLARTTLRNFAEEMKANAKELQQKRQYHETLEREVRQLLAGSEPLTEARFYQNWRGLEPVFYKHTAWDLAVGTQALSYLPPNLAFAISDVYTQQNAFQVLENSFVASAFTPATLSSDNMKGLAMSVSIYLTDVNIKEPRLLAQYSKVIPEIERAITH